MKLAIIETKESLDSLLAPVRAGGKRIAFVPTMGALHAGHISLVELAKKHADFVVVSIFVNPTQFGPNEDFDKYPRTQDADIKMLEQAGADAVFLPDVKTIYPDGFATNISVSALAKHWCGAARPGHFDGVATVVARLFGLVKPDAAIFGEKDFQQLAIIKRMVSDLALGVEIIGSPTMREEDGLAMSSRNRFLSESDRKIAMRLFEVMNQVKSGANNIEQAKKDLLAAGFTKLDYLALVDANTLEPIEKPMKPSRILAAAYLGNTRLIDNMEIL